jgi:hypothetical protein
MAKGPNGECCMNCEASVPPLDPKDLTTRGCEGFPRIALLAGIDARTGTPHYNFINPQVQSGEYRRCWRKKETVTLATHLPT